ncbi:MAG: PIG-L family deacetylase [Kiritimatiellia bacterium]|jgi:LmbE family N-acetylglucosaminyl deacetylase|nr:PIG-L family deacetylase [Kiritimatiellia bacterium]
MMKKRVLVLAPHPDDESITGLLPLRLREECAFEIWVLPVTLGSRPERRAERKRELRAACDQLGFRLRLLPSLSAGMVTVDEVAQQLTTLQPTVVFLPHERDGHPTHRATHRLGVAALDAASSPQAVVETEYWHPLLRPNLMVAADRPQLEHLCAALACHRGEIARNDYAARLPAWMIDNVRRGAELIGGPGAPAPGFNFATLYRARLRDRRRWRAPFRGTLTIESSVDLAQLVSCWG